MSRSEAAQQRRNAKKGLKNKQLRTYSQCLYCRHYDSITVICKQGFVYPESFTRALQMFKAGRLCPNHLICKDHRETIDVKNHPLCK